LLVKLRLERAADLLDGRASIAAIAQTCGYSDHSAFTRQFRAVVGVTPRDYRRLRAQR
jgi:AraC-like DNA-binding protein